MWDYPVITQLNYDNWQDYIDDNDNKVDKNNLQFYEMFSYDSLQS